MDGVAESSAAQSIQLRSAMWRVGVETSKIMLFLGRILANVTAVRFMYILLDISRLNLYSAPPYMCPSYRSWMFPLACRLVA